ncbi:MAG TPA: helix-turn-helix domain-containing protein [Bradyrhizobium sp.]|nr:helix-turn-helix domain-containing protein [Bradyrhizobium sp.]
MSMLEAGLSGGTVAILLLVAILSLRDSGRTPAGRNSALFLLSAVGYVICSAPGVASLDTPLGLSLLAVSLGLPALFWISAAAAFDDEFKQSWRRGFAWLGLVALGMWSLLDSQPIVGFAYSALSLLFVGLAAWHALAGRETDLVEARRRLRMLLAVSAASYGAVLIVTDVVSPGSSVSAPFSIVNAAGLATMTFAIALLWLGIAHEASAVSPTASNQQSSPRPEAPAAGPLDQQEAALLEALRELMEEQKLYRHDGLTIAVLAARLAIPEYRLRRLINRRLGHRNFSSFVNGYRLAEARAALADPVQANVPILTIALDTGFQSLAPFNRAFKMTAGMTPREYRRQHLSRPESRFAT